MRLLLVEDDATIADPLVRGLEREGFAVQRTATGRDALAALAPELDRDALPDLVLLDLGLPDIDGYEVCRRIRAHHDVPIIVITARGDEVDRVVGLELGADDYLVKPFGFRELVARIRAVTRRVDRTGTTAGPGDEGNPDGAAGTSPVRERAVLSCGAIEVDTRTRRVRVHGEEVALTRKEFGLLALLARDPGATRTREEILDEVWDPHWYGPTKTLDVHIASLRKKLGDPGAIETIRGVGFRMRDERTDTPS